MKKFIVLLLVATEASAGGLQLPTRGVASVMRGGASVAGGEGLEFWSTNPASIAFETGTNLHVDFSFVSRPLSYERVDSGGNALPSVKDQNKGLPIPTLAASWKFNSKIRFAAGLYAPYGGLPKFDIDGPQRYSMGDMSQTAAIALGFGASYKVSDKLYVGGMVQNFVYRLAATSVVSSCPGQTFCAPEDPDFDAVVRADIWSFLSPSLSVGAVYLPKDNMRVGLSLQAPAKVTGGGSIEVTLPSDNIFDSAEINGNKADLDFWYAPIAAAGIEIRGKKWRAELSLQAEFWKMLDRIRIDPRDATIENVVGIGTYELGAIDLDFSFNNVYSARIGGQYSLSDTLTLSAGYAYETGASPDENVSVKLIDLDKHFLGAGLRYQKGKYTWSLALAATPRTTHTIAPGNGREAQVNPIRGAEDPPVFVNDGTYKQQWLLVGLGLKYKLK